MVAEWSPSCELDGAGAASSGAGFFAQQSENCWSGRRWDHVDGVRPGGEVSSCRGFCSVPGPLQSVQRAEMWGVILALQTSNAVHLGVDNLGVDRHVGRLLDGCRGPIPFELVNDGDLLLLIERMLHRRGLDTVRISKVRGHADEVMVLHDRVREDDRIGNNASDEAADFGRRRVGPAVVDARRNLSGVCGRWYLVVLDLHRFFIAIARACVNKMVGVVLLLILWHGLQVLVLRDVARCVLFGIVLFCQGRLDSGIPAGLLSLLLLYLC